MLKIPILLGSMRKGRKSDLVARYFFNRLSQEAGIETELIDINELNLPVMEERVRMDPNAPEGAKRLSATLSNAHGLVIVSPEYHWSVPGSLKNVLDYIGPEMKRKPIGLITVSSGAMGGMQLAVAFRSIAASMGAYLVPQLFPVTKVAEGFGPDGQALDPLIETRATSFIAELRWVAEAFAEKKPAQQPA